MKIHMTLSKQPLNALYLFIAIAAQYLLAVPEYTGIQFIGHPLTVSPSEESILQLDLDQPIPYYVSGELGESYRQLLRGRSERQGFRSY
jgi:hypothetical protein